MADLPVPTQFTVFTPFLNGVFSQWPQTPFGLEDRTFITAEQWMMYAKATLFDDASVAEQIATTPAPADQKRLGQTVRNFDQAIWDQ